MSSTTVYEHVSKTGTFTAKVSTRDVPGGYDYETFSLEYDSRDFTFFLSPEQIEAIHTACGEWIDKRRVDKDNALIEYGNAQADDLAIAQGERLYNEA